LLPPPPAPISPPPRVGDDDEDYDDDDQPYEEDADSGSSARSYDRRPRKHKSSARRAPVKRQAPSPIPDIGDDSDAESTSLLNDVAITMYLDECKKDSYHNSLGGRSPNKATTYATMIATAIMAMPRGRAKVRDIYDFVEKHQEMLRGGLPSNYKFSIRHNLSTRPCFYHVEDKFKRHSSWWMVKEAKLPDAARAAVKAMRDLEMHLLKSSSTHNSEVEL
jgi:hypothetical protein